MIYKALILMIIYGLKSKKEILDKSDVFVATNKLTIDEYLDIVWRCDKL